MASWFLFTTRRLIKRSHSHLVHIELGLSMGHDSVSICFGDLELLYQLLTRLDSQTHDYS